MRPLGGVFLWGMVLAAGTTNFVVKHTVQRLDDELNSTRRKAVAEQKQIHDLTAEWTYLNQPELLSDLNRRYVGLVPVAPKQIQRNIDDIPLRPATAPPDQPAAEPQTMTARTLAPAATPQTPAAAAPNPGAPQSPIVPVSATGMTHVAPQPASAAPAGAPSLDALFAQVAGGR